MNIKIRVIKPFLDLLHNLEKRRRGDVLEIDRGRALELISKGFATSEEPIEEEPVEEPVEEVKKAKRPAKKITKELKVDNLETKPKK